ncbi:hypothetical protein ABEB36_006698 [Hypothenemus hampei]|uniref:Cell cycle checkpoint control protein n=1 Tax=Hypothenemus hampei TaxID=57062 RepID=A0ABD1ERG2_HYPHA
MNCVVTSLNVKVLAKAIHSLAKIGNELFIEAKPDKLSFLTFNQCKTVCAQFHMLDSFFSVFNVGIQNLDENVPINCKIHMKTLLPMFKGTNLEKKLEFMQIEYEYPKDRIKFRVKYRTDDIIVSHILCLMDAESLSIDNILESTKNRICASSSFYNDLLILLNNSDDITFDVSKDKVVARNYSVGVLQKPKLVRSQVNLNKSEFMLYQIEEETTINFSLKPLRAAILLAETCNLNMYINFDKGGRPLSFVMKNPTVEIIFLVATMNPSDCNSTLATTSLGTRISQANSNGIHNDLSGRDLENVGDKNWEELDDNRDNVEKLTQTNKNEKSLSKMNFTSYLNNNRKTANGGRKQFLLAGESDEDWRNSEQIPKSPESPRSKRLKLIFKRSYDSTFHASILDNILLNDSDSE